MIIPARNAGKYIAEAFDSLLEQTDPSWQAIVINDGSTDETQSIIDEYSARHPGKFVSFEGPGVGVSSARNLGLDKAHGERIMFLDSDDWVDPRWLELMNGAMDSVPGSVAAFCGFKRVMVDGQTHDMPIYHDLTTTPFEVMARVCAVGIHSVLLDRQELLEVGRFDTSMPNCEDWDLWQRIARRSGKWVEVNAYLSYYRCGHTSLSQNVRNVMEQSEIVLGRGFSSDARVPDPAPQNRNGVRPHYPGEFFDRISGLSAWCMGSSAGSSQPVSEIRQLLRPLRKDQIDWLPNSIIEGFVQGSGIAGSALAEHWDTVAPRIETVLAVIGERWQDPEALERLREGIQVAAYSLGTLCNPLRIGQTLLVHVDLNAPQTVRTFDGIDRLTAVLRDGDKTIGEARLGILDEIPAEDWMLIALSVIDHDVLAQRFPEAFKEAERRLRQAAPAVPPRVPTVTNSSEAARIAAEQRLHVPVLMYHAVAPTGPVELDRYRVTPKQFDAQMRWLKEQHYHTITSADLAWHLANHEPFAGRPVIITFDDGMQNFADHAWPILKKHGFVAEMFVVTDLLGKTSVWDAEFGSNYRLMDADTIRTLASGGVVFGSHMATHPKSDQLSSTELFDELVRSREALAGILGAPPLAIAAPYGILDLRYAEFARRAGYAICYGTQHSPVYLGTLPLQVPRLEVFGGYTLNAFSNAMKSHLVPHVEDMASDAPISVVVPARDAETTIRETLRSLLAQTHTNLEIIVVDASRDATAARVRDLAATDPRIRLISLENASLTQARNAGWAAATSEVVAFVDAGDLAAPNKLRLMYSALSHADEDVGLAYDWAHFIDDAGDIVASDAPVFNFGAVLPELLAGAFLPNSSAILVWRRVLETAGGFKAPPDDEQDDASMREFCLRVAESYRFAQVPEFLTSRRRGKLAPRGNAGSDMRAWYWAGNEIGKRHPDRLQAVRKGERLKARQLVSEALRARRLPEMIRLLLVIAPQDPWLAFTLPLVAGKRVGQHVAARLGLPRLSRLRGLIRRFRAALAGLVSKSR